MALIFKKNRAPVSFKPATPLMQTLFAKVEVRFAPLARRCSEQRDVEQVSFVSVGEPLGLFGEITLRQCPFSLSIASRST